MKRFESGQVWHPSGMHGILEAVFRGYRSPTRSTPGYRLASLRDAFWFSRSRAFTTWDLLIVVVTVVVFVFLLQILPALSGSRRAPRPVCASNLKQVALGFVLWANDHDKPFPMQVSTNEGGSMEYVGAGPVFRHFLAVSGELNSPKILLCPSDKTRGRRVESFAELRDKNLSYFVDVDARMPNSDHWLVGDYNLSTNGRAVRAGLLHLTTNHQVGWTKRVHEGAGNVCLVDGSVQMSTSDDLPEMLRKTGLATNRLAIP